jgi:excisionase family DNA binding protein
MDIQKSKLLSLKETADILSVTTRTLKTMVKVRRVISCVVVGNRYKFRPEDIENYLSKVRVNAADTSAFKK